MNDQVYRFKYDLPGAGRLDKFLVEQLPEFTRSRLQGLIRDGFVLVNDKVATKSGLTVERNMEIILRVPPPQPSDLIPENIPLEVIFENDDLIVVNKPAGMVVHPAAGHHSGTLVNAALAHAPELEGINGEQRPGVVHRLDKDTSGLILLAKNDRAQHWLQDQFRLRQVKKLYLALVDGHPPTPSGRIEAAIGRDSSARKQMAVVPDQKGREAVSEYFTREVFAHHTLLEVHPLTGRTHQIRVHLSFLGCPVVADPIYGHRKPTLDLHRHFLHAYRLTVTLPGETVERTFEAPLPDELEAILVQLRRSNI
jgi:23S rRNA pseudouridine1911/1915/1917 synthase